MKNSRELDQRIAELSRKRRPVSDLATTSTQMYDYFQLGLQISRIVQSLMGNSGRFSKKRLYFFVAAAAAVAAFYYTPILRERIARWWQR